MRAWVFLAGALLIPAACAPHAMAETVEMDSPSSASDDAEGSLGRAIDDFSNLASWADFPEQYAQSVISTASGMLAGRDGVKWALRCHR